LKQEEEERFCIDAEAAEAARLQRQEEDECRRIDAEAI